MMVTATVDRTAIRGQVNTRFDAVRDAPAAPPTHGSGGALDFADPGAGLGYAYVTSQMGTTLTGDPRDVALRDGLYAAIRK